MSSCSRLLLGIQSTTASQKPCYCCCCCRLFETKCLHNPSWLLGEPLPTQWDSAHIQESKANRAASHRHEFTSFCI
ncbi:hypothetical protein BDV35DRAFT_334439 [Aspergillus flavus]|uniref:Uncharacterized protein n=1 Tax=Aspergillus flavus TaxID=5059 RepID=A0A5N6HH41_ASPFL|nr:hypothetical protein BDV35DRAFT_334439 [Aspergillus flavus]